MILAERGRGVVVNAEGASKGGKSQLGTMSLLQALVLSKTCSKDGAISHPPKHQEEKEPALRHQPHLPDYSILSVSSLLSSSQP